MIKRIAFSVFIITMSISSFAQRNYDRAVGIRGSYYTNFNLTYKQFINDQDAFELIGGIRVSRFGFFYTEGAAIYQRHFPLEIEDIEGLSYYVGVGAYSGFSNTSIFNLGFMVGGGIDYKFEDYPINLSFDLFPALNILTRFRPRIRHGGLAIRYTLE